MNRSNVGNIVTNAMQIGSVGATTFAGLKAHWNKEEQDTVLSNLREQERQKRQAEREHKLQQSDAMHEQKMKNLSAKEQDILASVSAKQELTRGRKARADLAEAKTEEYKKAHSEESPEEEFARVEESLISDSGSPQFPNIENIIHYNVGYANERALRTQGTDKTPIDWANVKKGGDK